MSSREDMIGECDMMWLTLSSWAQDRSLTKEELYAVSDAMLALTDLQNRLERNKGRWDDGSL